MRHLSILVADDAEGIQQLLQELLNSAGHEVTCVSGGSEALKVSKKQKFDLVITDILMPNGDGLELIMELKNSRPPVPILAISGGGSYVQTDDCLRSARALGAQAALRKPFNLPQLMESISLAVPDMRQAS